MLPKKRKATAYHGFEKREGAYSEVKVCSRVALKSPSKGEARIAKLFKRKGLTIRDFEQGHRRLVKAGIPVVSIRGRVGPLVPGKALARQKMDTLIMEKVRRPTYEEFVENIGAVADIIDMGSRRRMFIDSQTRNFGIGADGKMKLLDFYPVYATRHMTANHAYNFNTSDFVKSANAQFGKERSEELESLLARELERIRKDRRARK